MAEIGKQFSHLTVALGLLPGQFEDSALLRDLTQVFVGETHGVQELEGVFWDLYTKRWLWIAEGAQLDGLGDILDEPRASADDDEYRDLLYLKVLINVSEGEPERIIEATQRATDGTEVHLIERDVATVEVFALALVKTAWIPRIAKVTAGGIRTVVTGSPSPNPFVFGVDRDAAGVGAGAELDYGTGWGESGAGNTTEGGLFTELYLDA